MRVHPGSFAFLFAATVLIAMFAARPVSAADMPELYFVDAHSQLPGGLDPLEIVPLMNQAGV